ncbi:hypothetical protein DAPPUDRAFT_246363 [Daphnia pulex]|uniref:Uncharacterized protein n=1 Tax=Daphnia pulex TaxID=6669 RepID=E9GQA6_DAPPU|nr:hypothetical protein DAPPUDRAFT_246363 [Daphnia pulex]|eukprot:EFX78375.1 hypothetical protein DAPPUDRAFT_246363 [Daphnia pulex]
MLSMSYTARFRDHARHDHIYINKDLTIKSKADKLKPNNSRELARGCVRHILAKGVVRPVVDEAGEEAPS